MDANTLSSQVLGKAVLRAAEGLGMSLADLEQLLSLSAQDTANSQVALMPGSIASRRALALVEVFQRTSNLVGNDPRQLKLWAASPSRLLGAAPCHLLASPEGLDVVLNYLRGAQMP